MTHERHANLDDDAADVPPPAGGTGIRPGADRVATLVERWLDGGITAAEVAEMETALRESSAARQVFWSGAALHGLLHEAARIRFSELPASALGTVVPDDRGSATLPSGAVGAGRAGGQGTADASAWQRPMPWPRWRRPDFAAASALILVFGVLLGSLATSLAVAHVDRQLAEPPKPVLVVAESFEMPPAPDANYLPTVADCWSGDETSVVRRDARGSDGVLPHSGDCMLRFTSGHPRGETYPGVASELWRFIALDELRSLAGSHEIRVEFSAWFNTAAVPADARPVCGLRVVATELAPGEVDQQIWLKQREFGNPDEDALEARPVAIAETGDRLDRDPATWQRVAAVVAVPSHARYLLLHCYVRDRSDVPYAGSERSTVQYVDDVTVSVEPMPAPRPAREQRVSTAGDAAGR
jgi:hypothetical protein